jgi:hypothetical protein
MTQESTAIQRVYRLGYVHGKKGQDGIPRASDSNLLFYAAIQECKEKKKAVDLQELSA